MSDTDGFTKGRWVRIVSGFMGAGREGVIVTDPGDVVTVEFMGPALLTRPDGPQMLHCFPYSRDELVLIEDAPAARNR